MKPTPMTTVLNHVSLFYSTRKSEKNITAVEN